MPGRKPLPNSIRFAKIAAKRPGTAAKMAGREFIRKGEENLARNHPILNLLLGGSPVERANTRINKTSLTRTQEATNVEYENTDKIAKDSLEYTRQSNSLLNQIIEAYKERNRTPGGSFPDIPGIDLNRRRPGRRGPRRTARTPRFRPSFPRPAIPGAAIGSTAVVGGIVAGGVAATLGTAHVLHSTEQGRQYREAIREQTATSGFSLIGAMDPNLALGAAIMDAPEAQRALNPNEERNARINAHPDSGMARIIMQNNLFTEAAAERYFRSRMPRLNANHPESRRYEEQFQRSMNRWRAVMNAAQNQNFRTEERIEEGPEAVLPNLVAGSTEEQQKQTQEKLNNKIQNNLADLLTRHEFDEINFEADQIEFEGDVEFYRADAVTRSLASAGTAGGQQQSNAEPGSAQQQPSATMVSAASPLGGTNSQVVSGNNQPPGTSTQTRITPTAATPGLQQNRGGTPTRGSGDEALRFFLSKGWTAAQAAGIVANLHVETGGTFNPEAVGDSGRAYGIAQWHPDRQANFRAWSGQDIRGSTFQQQLEFVHYELTQGRERGAGVRIRQTTTPEQAAEIVDRFYERSSGAHRRQRIELATSYASAINRLQPGQPQSGTELVTSGQNMINAEQQTVSAAQRTVATSSQHPSSTSPAPTTTASTAGEVPLNRRLLNHARAA